MSKKAPLPLRIAPLQGVIAVVITDPAEQAALDKARKRSKRKQGGRKAKKDSDAAGAASNPRAKKNDNSTPI